MTNQRLIDKIIEGKAITPSMEEQAKAIYLVLENTPAFRNIEDKIIPLIEATLESAESLNNPFVVGFISDIQARMKNESGTLTISLITELGTVLEITLYTELRNEIPQFSMGLSGNDERFCERIGNKISSAASEKGHGVRHFHNTSHAEAWKEHLKGTH